MAKLSVIVPCYNEQEVLDYFYDELQKVIQKMPDIEFEILLVNDGSRDDTLLKMRALAKQDPQVRYLSFSRNFGKEAGIYAGLKNATGDFVAIMDADLQDPPSLLPEMLRCITEEGYQSVATRRVTRKGEPPVRSFFARMFYRMMNKISNTDMVDGARDYRLMSRQFVEALLQLCEYNRFSKGLFGWVGFRTKWLEFENVERVAGETKWSFWSLFQYSIEGIVAFSTVPLRIIVLLGILLMAIGFIWGVAAIAFIVFGQGVSGMVLLAILGLLLGGIQLLSLGIVGEYLAKTYWEVKKRPVYIIGETNIEQPKTSKES